ncbi:amidohydrolase family protein [Herbiconiux sp. A18JL235]|uniref:Amidohydrolase family protein n=1 Tax=Herbiconiux sp. A18JL235 TaxID=3152363 RepID=A0AB39BIG2_9MICO
MMIDIAPGTATLITGARVFTAADAEGLVDAAVLIGVDGRIVSVGPEQRVREEAGDGELREIELDGRVLSPGLINMHVHLGLALPGSAGAEIAGKSDPDLLLVMADGAKRTLHAGITTTRLVGESRYLDFALRRGIDAGIVPGPRIFTAGHALCCTGGHGWESDALEGDGADELRRLARLQIRHGADLIKVCISGGIAGEHEQIDTPQLTDDEMASIIQVAHDWGRKVTAHVGPSDALRRAIELGLDCVEHGYQLTTEVTALMADRGVWYVPTITVSRCEEFFDAQGVPEWMKSRALGAGPRHWESLQNAIASGVQIAMGTDMPPAAAFDGTTATVREMEFMVEAGMTPLAVMRSATARAADLLGTDTLGRIEPGAHADLIATPEDPTTDISALRGLDWVMKGGVVVRDDRKATA